MQLAGSERVYAAMLLALAPGLCALGVAIAAHVVGFSQGGDRNHFVALLLGWAGGTGIIARSLRHRWANIAQPSLIRLLVAAAASLGTAVGVAALTSQWQDLMSEPKPTPLMVLKDLIATFAPIAGALLAPWLALSFRERSPGPTTGIPHGRDAA